MVDVYDVILQINILKRQSTKLGYSHSGMEKDVNRFVVFVVKVIVMYEFEELAHFIPRNCLSGNRIVYQNSCKLETEWITELVLDIK